MRILLAASFAAAFAFVPAAAQAGGDCGKGRDCYKLVETGPVYETIHEDVLVARLAA